MAHPGTEVDGAPRSEYLTVILRTRVIYELLLYRQLLPKKTSQCSYTVESVLSGPVLSSHPLLSGHMAKSREFCNINTIKVTSIERSPLLSGRGHLFHNPKLNFSLF